MSEPAAPAPSSSMHASWLRTRLSVERTYLSWVRTSTSLVAFGFTIAKFLPELAVVEVRPHAARNFGLALIAVGVLTMVVGIFQRRTELRYLTGPAYAELSSPEERPAPSPRALGGPALVVAGIAAILWILFG